MRHSTRSRETGFSLVEVLAASVILSLVITGISSLLAGYSRSRIAAASGVVGRNIASSILDDIQMRLLIENSLTTDKLQRSRTVYLPGPNVSVSRYFYWCFPSFPTGMTHNTASPIWDATNVTSAAENVSIARPSPGRLYGGGGAELATTDVNAPEVTYIARISVMGSDSPDLRLGQANCASNLREFVNGRKQVGATTYTTGEFVDTAYNPASRNTDAWCWITDTNGSYSAFTSTDTTRLNNLVTKVVVVRVYERSVYVQRPPANSFTGKPRVAESYTVFGGQVRI
ncbi:MAG: prepilin-type N-terminal cleavage/methylation domain-containing protein [bacterium]|nr:prepilin-type N-terminal cleavage/methylation domain-containing protein [bacterium]